MAPDEAIPNTQSLASGSVVPIANSQPVVSINVDTTKTFSCSLIPYYMYMYSMYIHIYTLYGIQDPGPCIHVTVYTDPYPVPHETTNTVYH